MDIILNELSVAEEYLPATAAEANSLLDQWLVLVESIAKQHRITPQFRPSNLVATSFSNLKVAVDGYVFSQWLRNMPIQRRALALSATKGGWFIRETYPEYRFRSPVPEYCQDAECVGFAYAIENNCLTWSLDSKQQWTEPQYQLVRIAFSDELESIEEDLSSWHVPSTGLSASHQPYFDSLLTNAEQDIKQACQTGEDILANWAVWFPNLRLTNPAEHGLQKLPSAMAHPIVERLLRLQRFFQTWDGVPIDYAILGFHTNRESLSRSQGLDSLTVTMPEGGLQLMDWHMRYPLGRRGSGRLFFIPEATSKSCYIGYIGSKDGVT